MATVLVDTFFTSAVVKVTSLTSPHVRTACSGRFNVGGGGLLFIYSCLKLLSLRHSGGT